MKKTGSQKIRLGLFVIISTLFFVFAIYLIGQRQDMFRKTFTISVVFQNVNGLQKGNNVRYSGIDIGTVNNIEMSNDSTIKVDMIIKEKIIDHIKKNAIATIGSDGLVGNMIVNIIPGKGNASVVSDGDFIESYSKIGADDILNTLSVTNENAAILTADMLKITNAMIEGKGTLGILLNDTIMANDLKQSITNIKIVSSGASRSMNELNNLITSLKTDDESAVGILLNDTLTGQKLKNIVNNLENSSTEIKKMVTNINTVLENIKTGEGAINYLAKDTTLVNNLKTTIKNINEGTDKFNQNMEALKHNFLFRGYFRKLEKEQKKAEKKN